MAGIEPAYHPFHFGKVRSRQLSYTVYVFDDFAKRVRFANPQPLFSDGALFLLSGSAIVNQFNPCGQTARAIAGLPCVIASPHNHPDVVQHQVVDC